MISAFLIRFQKAQDFLIVDDVVAQSDAFVADEDGRSGNEGLRTSCWLLPQNEQ